MSNLEKKLVLPVVIKGGIYEHHKGGMYVVLHVAQDSNNDRDKERGVVYMSLTPPKAGHIRFRHVNEFCELVAWPSKEPTPFWAPRFMFMGMSEEDSAVAYPRESVEEQPRGAPSPMDSAQAWVEGWPAEEPPSSSS